MVHLALLSVGSLHSNVLMVVVPDLAFLRSGTKCDVLAALAKLLAENGKDIRAAALKSLEIAYEFQGEGEELLPAASAPPCMFEQYSLLLRPSHSAWLCACP